MSINVILIDKVLLVTYIKISCVIVGFYCILVTMRVLQQPVWCGII